MTIQFDERNLFDILGVAENASLAVIKKKYRELAMKWHPDKNPANKTQAEAKFKDIAWAYEILSDEAKKQEYLQHRAASTPKSSKKEWAPSDNYNFYTPPHFGFDPVSFFKSKYNSFFKFNYPDFDDSNTFEAEIVELLKKLDLYTQDNESKISSLTYAKKKALHNTLQFAKPYTMPQDFLDVLLSKGDFELNEINAALALFKQLDLVNAQNIMMLIKIDYFAIGHLKSLIKEMQTLDIEIKDLNSTPLLDSPDALDLSSLVSTVRLLKNHQYPLSSTTLNLLFNQVKRIFGLDSILNTVFTRNKSLVTDSFLSQLFALDLDKYVRFLWSSNFTTLHKQAPQLISSDVVIATLEHNAGFTLLASVLESATDTKTNKLKLSEKAIIESCKYPAAITILINHATEYNSNFTAEHSLAVLENAIHAETMDKVLEHLVPKKVSTPLLTHAITMSTKSNDAGAILNEIEKMELKEFAQRQQNEIVQIKNNLKLDWTNIEHLKHWNKLTSRGFFNCGGKAVIRDGEEFRVPTRVYKMMKASVTTQHYVLKEQYIAELALHRTGASSLANNPFSFMTRHKKTQQLYDAPNLEHLVL